MADGNAATKADQNEAMYHMASEWFVGLGLIIDDIDLGDAMKYDVLRVSGRLLERGQGDGRTEQQSGS